MNPMKFVKHFDLSKYYRDNDAHFKKYNFCDYSSIAEPSVLAISAMGAYIFLKFLKWSSDFITAILLTSENYVVLEQELLLKASLFALLVLWIVTLFPLPRACDSMTVHVLLAAGV